MSVMNVRIDIPLVCRLNCFRLWAPYSIAPEAAVLLRGEAIWRAMSDLGRSAHVRERK
ncbi:hypothetical protein BQ8794_220048 [Mesorhizobium prunaredense]|uniref:Uncharacterized protein n=1 Tax=Mesorhizobium prunaredense TaxID=1631249 RepID=A0A1R3V6D6_9HYPH|nr:hypothetical protein BQ8794_220048 [Mesorhizobium prunaredense]